MLLISRMWPQGRVLPMPELVDYLDFVLFCSAVKEYSESIPPAKLTTLIQSLVTHCYQCFKELNGNVQHLLVVFNICLLQTIQ